MFKAAGLYSLLSFDEPDVNPEIFINSVRRFSI